YSSESIVTKGLRANFGLFAEMGAKPLPGPHEHLYSSERQKIQRRFSEPVGKVALDETSEQPEFIISSVLV
ncbi:hypothetical protein, partial [Vibrio jasicida]